MFRPEVTALVRRKGGYDARVSEVQSLLLSLSSAGWIHPGSPRGTPLTHTPHPLLTARAQLGGNLRKGPASLSGDIYDMLYSLHRCGWSLLRKEPQRFGREATIHQKSA